MRKEYDFSQAKRAKDVPHLSKLQEDTAKGKTRITIYIDDDVISWFKTKAAEVDGNYQTMINAELKRIISNEKPLKELIKEAIREELQKAA
jgi:uncharacterized protein (DUF4415 family)